jgi:hypothetical protein
MILGGYLILPTTFNEDPNLRFNKGVLAIIIVALLTGGYSLTALVWFACPASLFRLDHIFIPVFSVSMFAFCATCYALASSSRYVFSQASAPVTLALTLASALLYGVFSLMMSRRVKKMRTPSEPSQYAQNTAPAAGGWQDPSQYQTYTTLYTQPSASTRSANTAYEPWGSPSPHSYEGNAVIANTQRQSEEELVKHNLGALLTRPDQSLAQRSSTSTYHLEWPQGEEREAELEGSSERPRHASVDNSQLLKPGSAGRKRSKSTGNTARHTYSPGTRGRADSRDERRREIEMNNLSR